MVYLSLHNLFSNVYILTVYKVSPVHLHLFVFAQMPLIPHSSQVMYSTIIDSKVVYVV